MFFSFDQLHSYTFSFSHTTPRRDSTLDKGNLKEKKSNLMTRQDWEKETKNIYDLMLFW